MHVYSIDPEYCEKSVPNLDGCEGHSDHIIFGSNIEIPVQSEDGAAHLATGQSDGAGESSKGHATGEAEKMVDEFSAQETQAKPTDSDQAAKI